MGCSWLFVSGRLVARGIVLSVSHILESGTFCSRLAMPRECVKVTIICINKLSSAVSSFMLKQRRGCRHTFS
jgi:hypothetical protein